MPAAAATATASSTPPPPPALPTPAVSRRLLTLTVALHALHLTASEILCAENGLYVDYDSDCQHYLRCTGGSVVARYSCPTDRAFSEALGACVPKKQQPCIRKSCNGDDTSAYASPGTACRHYYRCVNGTAREHACPPGTWFDWERQSCSRGAGACYEPLCTGLEDGPQPDPSHDCRRLLFCKAGALKALASCPENECIPPYFCPAPRSASVALPVGDADFCADEKCSSLCQFAQDGAHADRTSGCREYFVCSSKHVVRRGVCDQGQLFSKGGCETASKVNCLAPAKGVCFGKADGVYRDWKDCRSWFACRRDRVIARGSCDEGHRWDGEACVPPRQFECSGPKFSNSCDGKPTGLYQNISSNCTRYYHCEGMKRTDFSCPRELVFDGAKCTLPSNYLCPSLDKDSCYGKADGKYRARETACRSYYTCSAGVKAVYACPEGEVFDGVSCTHRTDACVGGDQSCLRLADGYHTDFQSGCQEYFYCEKGDRLVNLRCSSGKMFNGKACVDPNEFICKMKSTTKNVAADPCEKSGFFVHPQSGCRSYYFCLGGLRTSLQCPQNQLFNGQVCVPANAYACPEF